MAQLMPLPLTSVSVFDAEVGDSTSSDMMMILLVWQPDGWISYKQCKSQKKEK